MFRRAKQVQSPSTTLIVECLEDQPGFSLYCEPEGAVHEIAPGDKVTITFSGPSPQGFEVSRLLDGLVLARLDEGRVTISDKRGRTLNW